MIPAPERTAAEWGAVAIAIPGWEWRPGMLTQHRERVHEVGRGGYLLVVDDSDGDLLEVRADDGGPRAPDPDDDATAGVLLALFGPVQVSVLSQGSGLVFRASFQGPWARPRVVEGRTLGRTLIAAAEIRGSWLGAL